MKKFLPLLLLVMLAVAGCQRGPATYQYTDNPHEIVVNAEKFVNQVSKKSKHYTAEEWDAAVGQFVTMCKNYYENSKSLTNEEQMKFDKARLKFMDAISAAGKDAREGRLCKNYRELRRNHLLLLPNPM